MQSAKCTPNSFNVFRYCAEIRYNFEEKILCHFQIRFETDSHVGVVVLHCHLLSDADQGMSMLTEIVEPGEER